jgi:hypothetical protein
MAIATLLPTWFAPSALSGWCSDHPTLPFGLEVGKIVKYAGLNSDQLDLILGKNLARLLRIEPKPSAPKTMDITQIATGIGLKVNVYISNLF